MFDYQLFTLFFGSLLSLRLYKYSISDVYTMFLFCLASV